MSHPYCRYVPCSESTSGSTGFYSPEKLGTNTSKSLAMLYTGVYNLSLRRKSRTKEKASVVVVEKLRQRPQVQKVSNHMVTTLQQLNHSIPRPPITPHEVFVLNQKRRVKAFVGEVTGEQIGACTKIYDYQLRANVYMVQSESDPDREYRVTWDKECGYRCTCPSGQIAFTNVSHPSGVCKHVRWSVACAREEAAAMTDMDQDGIYSLDRLNDYQALLYYRPDDSYVHATIHQILEHRSDVVLNTQTNRWQLK